MTDLTKGIIEINGFTLTKNSKPSDFVNLSAEEAKVQVSKRGHTYIKFTKPMHSNGVDVFVEVAFYADSEVPEIKMWPSVPSELKGKYDEIAWHKLAAAKKWLKGMIAGTPHTSNDSCVFYKFDSVDYFSSINKDVHYGLVGGEIDVTFRGV